MARHVKEFVQIEKLSSLDALIDELVAVRASLPDSSEAEIRLRGCDVFGRHIVVCYQRPQTVAEAECDARYADAYAQVLQRQDQERRAEAERSGYRHLRAVA